MDSKLSIIPADDHVFKFDVLESACKLARQLIRRSQDYLNAFLKADIVSILECSFPWPALDSWPLTLLLPIVDSSLADLHAVRSRVLHSTHFFEFALHWLTDDALIQCHVCFTSAIIS